MIHLSFMYRAKIGNDKLMRPFFSTIYHISMKKVKACLSNSSLCIFIRYLWDFNYLTTSLSILNLPILHNSKK